MRKPLEICRIPALTFGVAGLAASTARAREPVHASVTVRLGIRDRPKAFELELRGVPDVPVRVLRWPAPAPGGGAKR